MRACEVYVHGKKAGLLAESDSGEYTFAYDKDYLSDKNNPSVCIAMPLGEKTFRSKSLFPFFFNMLSEGENREIQSRLLHIPAEDDFGILLATAHTDTIGAVTVKAIRQ